MTSVGEGWEQEAENWVRWTRTPGFDAYWYYGDAFFAHIVPPAGRQTLEIGSGEGRVARDLARRGHVVTGVDTSATLLRYARDEDPAGRYLLTDAAALPFADGEFDLVVAYNSLMDIKDMPGAVREAARVLSPGGRFCICVTHPLNDAGRFESDEPDAPFIIRGSYLASRTFDETFERDGLTMTFHGYCHPLGAYTQALEEAGFLIERVREPAASETGVAAKASFLKWQRVPMFLHIRAVKA
jgi:SAM-dependent methyltransferase